MSGVSFEVTWVVNKLGISDGEVPGIKIRVSYRRKLWVEERTHMVSTDISMKGVLYYNLKGEVSGT